MWQRSKKIDRLSKWATPTIKDHADDEFDDNVDDNDDENENENDGEDDDNNTISKRRKQDYNDIGGTHANNDNHWLLIRLSDLLRFQFHALVLNFFRLVFFLYIL